jgi:hypothetical protein
VKLDLRGGAVQECVVYVHYLSLQFELTRTVNVIYVSSVVGYALSS